MPARQQNSTIYPIGILLVSAVDYTTGVPGATITLFEITKDGGTTWSAPSGVLTDAGFGWLDWAPAAGDRDTLGELRYHVVATGCVDVDDSVDIVAYDPFAYPSLLPGERTAIADAVLTRDWTQVASWPARCMLQALRFLRNKWLVTPSGTPTSPLTVYLEDDATTAWTATVQTQGGADPITGQIPTS